MLIQIFGKFALIAILALFLLPCVDVLHDRATDISGQVAAETTLSLVHRSNINPSDVQQAPLEINVTDVLGFDEIMSPISTLPNYSDYMIPTPLPKNEMQSPAPGNDDQSEYMIGDVAVTVIFPESNGTIDQNKESWTSSRMDNCISKINAGLTWLQNQEPKAHLNFNVYTYYTKPTSYEPITRPSTDQSLWMDEILTGLGFTSGSYFQKIRDLNNFARSNYNKDWAYTIFVVDSLNDTDGKFTNGYSGYAYLGGPFAVMTYDNGGWGINYMDKVTAHETGHIFYATDEYNSKLEYSGYLNIRDNDGANCIMNNISWTACASTRGQIGWIDSDGDGILDPIDTIPQTILNPIGATSNNVLTCVGTAQDMPLTNKNPSGPRNNVTINKIATVQYRIDNGQWYNAISDDGAFDEVTETFSFKTPSLSSGAHVVQTRAQNSVGNWETSYSMDSVEVDTTNPTATLNSIQDSLKSLTQISGTAADAIPGQVNKVQIEIKNVTNSTYWNGISWVTNIIWLDATGTTSWSYSMPPLTSNKSYEVGAKSIDMMGNESPITLESFTTNTTGPIWVWAVIGVAGLAGVLIIGVVFVKLRHRLF